MANNKRYTPEPKSAPGDFYDVQSECLACGVPHVVASDLVGWLDGDPSYASCYWIKPPKTPGEFERAFLIFDGQEVGCHRYAGTDPLIQIRIGLDNCDNAIGAFRSASDTEPHSRIWTAAWGKRFAGYSPNATQPNLLRRRLDRFRLTD